MNNWTLKFDGTIFYNCFCCAEIIFINMLYNCSFSSGKFLNSVWLFWWENADFPILLNKTSTVLLLNMGYFIPAMRGQVSRMLATTAY
jgi:hypothetical protein